MSLPYLVTACEHSKSTPKALESDHVNHEDLLKSTALIGQGDPKKKLEVHRFFQEIMGTTFRLQLVAYNYNVALSAARATFNEVRRIEHLISSWRADSEIGRLNHFAGQKSVLISYETAWLLCQSRRISKLTHGVFDITWAALKGLWNFKTQIIPKHDLLKKRLQVVGSQHIKLEINDHTQQVKQCSEINTLLPHPIWTKYTSKPPSEWSWKYQAKLGLQHNQIDLGGIAKGFAVDSAARFLRRLGFQNFVVDGGGDMLVNGRDLNERPWSIGIQHPRSGQIWGTLWIPSEWAVVTSGDYERFFYFQDQRYHHIIDLRTGYPAQGSVAMTVIAKNAMLADALATALFVLGPYEGIALADSISGLEAICFTPTGEVIYSQGASIFSPQLPKRWRE